MKEEEPGFIAKFFDKAYEAKSILELAKAPVTAISGVSESDAEALKKAFGIETVEDLAKNRYVKLAQGINFFSACSGEILDKKFESEEYKNLAEKPVSAISGVSEADAALLKKVFGIDTIRELAENKYVAIAQATVSLSSLVVFLKVAGVL
jgi:predicted RecB family nuclease